MHFSGKKTYFPKMNVGLRFSICRIKNGLASIFRIWVTSSFLPGDTKTTLKNRAADRLWARQQCPVGKAAQGADIWGSDQRRAWLPFAAAPGRGGASLLARDAAEPPPGAAP